MKKIWGRFGTTKSYVQLTSSQVQQSFHLFISGSFRVCLCYKTRYGLKFSELVQVYQVVNPCSIALVGIKIQAWEQHSRLKHPSM